MLLTEGQEGYYAFMGGCKPGIYRIYVLRDFTNFNVWPIKDNETAARDNETAARDKETADKGVVYEDSTLLVTNGKFNVHCDRIRHPNGWEWCGCRLKYTVLFYNNAIFFILRFLI